MCQIIVAHNYAYDAAFGSLVFRDLYAMNGILFFTLLGRFMRVTLVGKAEEMDQWAAMMESDVEKTKKVKGMVARSEIKDMFDLR